MVYLRQDTDQKATMNKKVYSIKSSTISINKQTIWPSITVNENLNLLQRKIIMNAPNLDTVIHLPLHGNIATRKEYSKLVFSWVYGLFSLLALVYLLLNYKPLFEFILLLFIICASSVVALVMYLLYIKSKQIIYTPADKIVKESVVYFGLGDFERLHEHLKTMNFSTLQDIKAEPSGNIRLDIFVSTDKRFVAAQLFQFIPYRYKAITPIYHFRDETALQFLEFIDIDSCKATSHKNEYNESH